MGEPDFPTGRFKMVEAPNGTEFWLEVTKQGSTYAVNQWQADIGSTEAQLRTAQAARATWLVPISSTGQEIKFRYTCDNSDHQGESTIAGFATLTRVSEGEIRYALVTPPSVGPVWDCNGDFDQEFNNYYKIGEALGAAKQPAAPAPSDGELTVGRPYEALFIKGATWTINGRVTLSRGDEIDKPSKFKQETKALSTTCMVEEVAQRPGKIVAAIRCSPHTWQPKVGNPGLLGAWPPLGGFWTASAKGLQHIAYAEDMAAALALPLQPDEEERITDVRVKSVVSDARTCFQNGFSTEESNYEHTLCLERSRGFTKVDAAVTWNIDIETEGMLGKTTDISYAAPNASR